jgi:hypothetical protein
LIGLAFFSAKFQNQRASWESRVNRPLRWERSRAAS